MLEGIWLVSYVALWILVLLEAIVILALARQIGLLHNRLGPTGARMGNAGLELGDDAPPFRVQGFNGRPVTLAAERDRPTLLIFISPTCSVCADLGSAILALYQHEKRDIEVVVVSFLEDEAENRAYIKRYRLNDIPYIVSPRIAEQYRVTTSPYAILVDSNGKVHTKGLVNNIEHLESLLNALDEGYPSHDSKMNALMMVKGNSNWRCSACGCRRG